MAKLLSFKALNLNREKPHHYEYGYQPERDMPYPERPYLRDGVKMARIYQTGIGGQMVHAIYYLK